MAKYKTFDEFVEGDDRINRMLEVFRACWNFATEAAEEKFKSTNSAMAKLLKRWLYPEDRGDIMDLTHETKSVLEKLRQ